MRISTLMTCLLFPMLLFAKSDTKNIPIDLKKMLDTFSEAVSNKNLSKASQLSSFPLRNIVYGGKQKISQKEFEASLKDGLEGFCYGDKKPLKDQKTSEWVLECDGNIFYFGLKAGKWKYLGYENINE